MVGFLACLLFVPFSLAYLFLNLGIVPTNASEIRLEPKHLVLRGTQDVQRLLVGRVEKGKWIGCITEGMVLTSSAPEIAEVDESGYVSAKGDGEAVITAMVGKHKAQARIIVRHTKTSVPQSFEHDVVPILTRLGCNSGACHGAQAGKGGLKLSLRGFDPDADYFVLTRQAQGRRADLQAPEQSLFLLKPLGKIKHGGGVKLEIDSQEYRILYAWLKEGAVRKDKEAISLRRIEAIPSNAVLRPAAQLPLIVRAFYSDGYIADVSRWAKFTSKDENIAKVTDDGQVTITGYGEAAITIWYANQVATVTITSPYEHSVSPIPDSPQQGVHHNFIDAEINRKLTTLHLPPSPPCTDQEFIRRAYLDLIGTLPRPQEVQEFLDDGQPGKRLALVEKLLARPEYVDYWTYRWSDLLLVSSRKLNQAGLWSFHQFIRQSVASNKRWDSFARDLLTAKGSNLTNGAVNYFVLHKDTSQLMETTSVTFLGMSLACARCHNHPLEKWTQDQYWAMANLFGRITLKNGERAGEVLLQPQPHGEVLHLRRGVAMPPTPLDGAPLLLSDRRDRREHFADWLTAPGNPYFARAIINRVWRNFMGRGLVEAEDDLRTTNPPSNSTLLTVLEQDFIDHGYDIQRLIRLIMTSAAYQRSARPLPGNLVDDRYYSRYFPRRLSAEVVLDAYSQLLAVPTPFNQLESNARDSVSSISDYPLGTRALQLPDTRIVSRFMDTFGRPERDAACACERQNEANLAQALHLSNGHTLNEKLRGENSLVDRWVREKIDINAAIRQLYLLALCRLPTPEEARELLTKVNADTGPLRERLEDLCWAVLTSREFLFNR